MHQFRLRQTELRLNVRQDLHLRQLVILPARQRLMLGPRLVLQRLNLVAPPELVTAPDRTLAINSVVLIAAPQERLAPLRRKNERLWSRHPVLDQEPAQHRVHQ